MMRKFPAVLLVGVLLCGGRAWAHRIDEYLQATIISLEPGRAIASMRLIPGVLVAPSIIAALDANGDGMLSDAEKHAYVQRVLKELSITVDGKPAKAYLDAWTVPDPSQLRDGLGEIHIGYHVDLPSGPAATRRLVLANHHLDARSVYLVNVEVPQSHDLQILDQKRNERQSVYELDFQQSRGLDSASYAHQPLLQWFRQLQVSSLFHLGMRHIAEGTDHLLFLLVLLLPAPLLAAGSRWSATAGVRRTLTHILGIVTAFTLGHSLTLTLAATHVVRVPGRPVEILIAISILVSALHALRPIFPGREAWIAAFFGLIHGLAFASTLDRLGLSRWERVAGILAFNLGIETMQVLVVALVLPSLLCLSRTRFYRFLRILGAAFACVASSLWILERVWQVQTPIDSLVNTIAQQGLLWAAALFLTSLACFAFSARPSLTLTVRPDGDR